ncbi:OmpA family protein [Pseudomonas sp. CCI3.2]|uniref:OmpA family protein n=1 Tax=unclassified Pseudomonas TaxID=196821 RepID=UPI002AC9ACE8|nr:MULTISPECIES: OmpA family protein [unclassified Pseudomonas]MEB0075738.1 OmpA family protein [Pseudomonas sp. MH10out]MEB0099785.1 OmpA family protein [Pseudomonas sp. CCI3.2]MEB0130987.1 OmpA family protein [Pseudomonas sp. CCI2.4]MEB0158199.1 OmpA family protein [Pseudomonas sp. AH2 (2023)]MEB0167290.1 OmpA family protein [Pseudomonas sp. CCC4.4]
MSSNKTIAFALCLAVTGCAQTPQNGSADGGINWWPFGAHQSADKAPDQATAGKPDAKVAAVAPAAPVAVKTEVAAAKADVKAAPAPAAAPVVAAAAPSTETHWWWPFETKQQKDAAKPLLALRAQPVPMPDPKVTQAWLDNYEPRLRVAIKDSPFELERRENILVITAPADSSFNHDRPTMLLPVTLGPITRLAKIVEADPTTAVLVLGHADTTGLSADNQKLTQDRASSVAAIFRLSGLERNRLGMRGMGSIMPRAANDSVEGRKLNRRIEIVMTPQVTMVALLSKYNMPAPGPTLAAAQTTPPVAATPAPGAKTVASTKKAPVKKAAAKKPVVKKASSVKKTTPAVPAKTDAPAKKDIPDDQAKAN